MVFMLSFNQQTCALHQPPPPGPFFSMLVKSPDMGAQPSVYLAVSEEMEGVTGRYYDVMTEKEPAPQALDEEAARQLWEVSSRLVGLEGLEESNPPAEVQSRAPQTAGEQRPGPSPGAAVDAARLEAGGG